MGTPKCIPNHVSVVREVEEILTALKEERDEQQRPPIILCKSVEYSIEN